MDAMLALDGWASHAAGPSCYAPLGESATAIPLSAIARAALPGYDPRASAVAVEEDGIRDCLGNPLSRMCDATGARTKVSSRGGLALPEGWRCVSSPKSASVCERECSSSRAGTPRRIEGMSPWSSRGDPLDCSFELRTIGAHPVLVEHAHDEGTCDNPSTSLIVRSMTSPQLKVLADLEVAGRVVPCESDAVWYADHESRVDFGSELRVTTTVTWQRLDDAAGLPVTRILHRTMRLTDDALVDPQAPDASGPARIVVGARPQ